ncbi:MAG: helical backbone metal receptor, partial [Candidatus Aminicenantales bacterium]
MKKTARARGDARGDMYLRYVSPVLSRLVLAALIVFTFCSHGAGREGGRVLQHVLNPDVPQVIKDDLGGPFPLPEGTPRRIVSMAPNITEILFALGLGGRIVGVTRFCDWPPEARAIPRIGGLVDPNVEVIRSLDPDLVIAFRGNPLRLVDRIRKLGLPVFVLD